MKDITNTLHVNFVRLFLKHRNSIHTKARIISQATNYSLITSLSEVGNMYDFRPIISRKSAAIDRSIFQE